MPIAFGLSAASGGLSPCVLPSVTGHLPSALTLSSAAGFSLSLPAVARLRPSVHPGNRCSAPRSARICLAPRFNS
eukprot:7108759-Pyramimonas_sp.AAC.1